MKIATSILSPERTQSDWGSSWEEKSVQLGSIKLLLLSREAPWNNPKEECVGGGIVNASKKISVFRLEEAEDSLKA